jgi:DNA-binding IclR family transcriptional regulator
LGFTGTMGPFAVQGRNGLATRKQKARKGIQSIEVGQRLLEVLASAPGPMALGELADAALMPPSKAHRYLVSYCRGGLIEQEGESGHYGLGRFALDLGLAALGRLEGISVALPVVRDLAKRLDQTVALAVWGNQGPTIVRWVGGDSPVSATLRVGSVMPLSRSATGQAFLAHLPENRWQSLLKRELADNTRQGIRPQSVAELSDRMRDIRTSGVSHTIEFIAGISGMAAPIFGDQGSMVLALVTLGYSAGFEPRQGEIRTALHQAAQQLSRRLGHRRTEEGGADGTSQANPQDSRTS